MLLFIFDGIFINAAIIITNGVFLSGYIVYLNGPDFLVGLLNDSATWASIVSVFSFVIYERMRKRKKFLITLNIFSRLLICSIIFVPLISNDSTITLAVVTIMIIIGNVIRGFYNIGITVMMIGLLPMRARSKYIYTRMFFLRISFTITTITMGFVLDYFNKSYIGFLILFMVSLALSIADIIVISKVKEPEYVIDKEFKFNRLSFFEPIRNNEFRRFLIFIFFFYFSICISKSYTSLYLLRYLNLNYSFISSINVITYALMIISVKFWSKVESNKGSIYVVRVASMIAACEVIFCSFLTKDTYYLLFASGVVSGVGYGGFNIAVLNYRYEIISESNRTIYEGWYGAVLGISLLFSPIIGSMIRSQLPYVNSNLLKYSNFQLMYIISFLFVMIVIFNMFYKKHRESKN